MLQIQRYISNFYMLQHTNFSKKCSSFNAQQDHAVADYRKTNL